MMTALIAVLFGLTFFVFGGIVIGGIAAWVFYGIGYNACEQKYGKTSDFKKKEVVTYEKK